MQMHLYGRLAYMETIENEVEIWARFLRVSQAVLAAVEADLKAAGFPPLAWYDALLELRRVAPEGLRQFQLRGHMLLAQYNLSRLIDRLDRAGFARCEACPEDGRGQVVYLTEKGRALIDAMWPAYRAAITAHFDARLDPGEVESLSAILEKLRPAP
jgi:DNA-binding MarR family transcriptional regulator